MAMFDVDIVFHEQLASDVRAGWRMVGETTENVVGIRFVCEQTFNGAEFFEKKITIGAHFGTTDLELLTVLRSTAQKCLGQAVEVPDGHS